MKRLLLLALLAGAAGAMAGCSQTSTADATRTVVEAVSDTQTVTVTETVSATAAEREQLEERAARLDDRAAELKVEGQEIARRKQALDKRKAQLDKRERRLVGAEAEAERAQFSDGTYLVGTDIPAGSYIAPGSGTCYWERRDPNVTGLGAIIENYVGSGQVRVTIAAGELFVSQQCGTWRPG